MSAVYFPKDKLEVLNALKSDKAAVENLKKIKMHR